MRSGVICRISYAVGPLPSDLVVWQAKQVPWNVAHPLSVPGKPPRPRAAAAPGWAGGTCAPETGGGACGACAPSHTVPTKTAAAATALIREVFFMVCILSFEF